MARKLLTIQKQMKALEIEMRAAERRESKGVEAVRKLMAKLGVSIADLQDFKGGRTNSLKGRPAAIKFRDSNGNTWTGRGRTPLWLVAAEKAGKKRESFLIKG